MERLDRARLEAADFRFVSEIQTRFDDIDSLGHLNNAAAAVILQEARVRLHTEAGFAVPGDVRAVVAALAIEFAGEMHFPAPVEVRTAVLHIGRTSYVLGQVAFQGGRPALYAETVMVTADANGPVPVPEALRAAFTRRA